MTPASVDREQAELRPSSGSQVPAAPRQLVGGSALGGCPLTVRTFRSCQRLGRPVGYSASRLRASNYSGQRRPRRPHVLRRHSNDSRTASYVCMTCLPVASQPQARAWRCCKGAPQLWLRRAPISVWLSQARRTVMRIPRRVPAGSSLSPRLSHCCTLRALAPRSQAPTLHHEGHDDRHHAGSVPYPR
jgi:hypothetical protein